MDPAATTARGPAYSTTDDRHLLNVPASGMSAFPRDPEHFFRWVRNHHDDQTQPQDFVPRRVYGDYLESLLQTAAEYPGNARLERLPIAWPGSTDAATASWCDSPRGSRSSRAPWCWPRARAREPTGQRPG